MEETTDQQPLLQSASSNSQDVSEQPGASVSSTPTPNSQSSSHLAKDVKVWLPSSLARPAPRPLPAEEDLTPTASELQRAFSGQTLQREKLTDAPMLTKALREREQNQKKTEKLARFPTTRIRIKFGDRSMLEGAFPSTCKLADIYQFVRETLVEEVRAKNFILYQTPPRREFLLTDSTIRSSNLIDLQLAPSSLLLIKFSEDTYNHNSNAPPLLPELLKSAEPLPPPPTIEGEGGNQLGETTKQKVTDAMKSAAKVPKWLQNMKKK